MPKVRKQLGLLKFIGKTMSEEGRKILATGLILSRICYLIPLWGGTQEKYIRKTQAVLNNTARWVLKRGKRTKTLRLMTDCKWLTIREMIKHYSLVAMWKIIWLKAPVYLHNKITINEDFCLQTSRPRLKTTKLSFRFRTTLTWNTMPMEIRQIKSLPMFKIKVKAWLISLRTPDPGLN